MDKFFILLLLTIAAHAQQTLTSVAVLPSDGNAINSTELEALTDEMREAALKVLPTSVFVLLKQDVVVKRLGGAENYIKICTESSCIVDLGKKAQVDYVSQASVSKLGNRIRLKVEPEPRPSLFGWQLGLRGGINLNNSPNHRGMQLGVVRDFAITEWFYLQPGIMYIQKGTFVDEGGYHYKYATQHIDIPLLLSFKYSALRLNAGPYFGLCIDDGGSNVDELDIGISLGVGFDIGMFYIGAFYGLQDDVLAIGLLVGVNL